MTWCNQTHNSEETLLLLVSLSRSQFNRESHVIWDGYQMKLHISAFINIYRNRIGNISFLKTPFLFSFPFKNTSSFTYKSMTDALLIHTLYVTREVIFPSLISVMFTVSFSFQVSSRLFTLSQWGTSGKSSFFLFFLKTKSCSILTKANGQERPSYVDLMNVPLFGLRNNSFILSLLCGLQKI